jgi:RHS repeat-associated protein
VDDPNGACALDYPTWHNRLLSYDIYDTSQTPRFHLREVKYTYYKAGWASNITIKDDSGDPNQVAWYHDLALYYWSHGPLRYALWGRWQVDGEGDPIPESYEALAAKEFRYDSARGRYFEVDFDLFNDPNNPSVTTPYPDYWTVSGPLRFTDYAGDTPLGDLDATLNAEGDGIESVLNTTRYFALAGHQTLDPNEQPVETAYWHEDLIGSTTLTTDESGSVGVPPAELAYSAFGELLTASGAPGGSPPSGAPRYQYAGAYGYESGLLSLQGANADLPPITLQHLGHRWYQRDIGRFVQRDPIGIRGGMNVYAYATNGPTRRVDPSGLWDGTQDIIDPPWFRGKPLPSTIDLINEIDNETQARDLANVAAWGI